MDLDKCLLEASASAVALCHEPSPPKRLRLSEMSANDDEAVPEWDCSAPYEQWLDYSAYEDRYKSPSLQFLDQISPEEIESSSIHDGEDEEQDGSVVEIRKNGKTTTMPTFFHPSTYIYFI